MGQLEDYVRQLRQQGYVSQQIRESLVRAGYSPATIDAVLAPVSAPLAVPAGVPHSKLPFVGLGAFVVLVCVLAYVFVFAPDVTVTLELSVPVLEYAQGDTVAFDRLLETAFGSDVGVRVSHQLVDPAGKVVQQKVETVVLDKKSRGTVRFSTRPDALPGKYVVKSVLTYEDKSVAQEVEVVVKEERKSLVAQLPAEQIVFEAPPEVVLECPKGCDDLNACTSDACVDGKCVFSPVAPCCGNGQCEQGESGLTCVKDCSARVETPAQVDERAQTAASKDPALALSFCSSIPLPQKADQCVYEVARKTNQSQSCSSISEDRVRDSCFMEFALAGDFSVCDVVKQEFLQRSCFSMDNLRRQQEQLALLQAQVQVPPETPGA
ncbi:hypothetical protein HY490_00570 [Candidatus Woesearchaeota archaeon]|nr:hypothetical protein [Candidatus Woesearchaeota archaeon]